MRGRNFGGGRVDFRRQPAKPDEERRGQLLAPGHRRPARDQMAESHGASLRSIREAIVGGRGVGWFGHERRWRSRQGSEDATEKARTENRSARPAQKPLRAASRSTTSPRSNYIMCP